MAKSRALVFFASMKNYVASAIMALICLGPWAQSSVLKPFENMTMRSIGPSAMSGRVTAIDVHPDDPDKIYAGTASGGLWLSENGGMSWTPLFDDQPVHSIGSLEIDPVNHDIIWAGTGEGNPRNSQTSGKGIYKSLDGGRSWQLMGLENTRTIHRVAVNFHDHDIVYAGASGSAWGSGPDRGVYKTDDGGISWKKVLFVNDSVGCADLVMDPSNPDKLFASMWQYGRKPWTFNSGGAGSGLYRTVDGGKNWAKITNENGLPEGPLGRIGIAIAPSDPKVVYALVESKKTALYKSTDGGYNWQLVTDKDVDDRPFYYHEIYVDPSNANRIIYLHSTVTESIDGGKSFHQFAGWEIHPDHHAFWWSKEDPTYMIEGNDGGLNISRDNGRSWQFASNLPLGQFYHIDYDMDTPYHVYGGMQDNGSWKGPGYTWNGGGIRSADWQEVLFGDGFDVVPYAGNSRYLYAMYQGGELNWVDSETGDGRGIKPVHPDGTKLRFHWNSGISADPFNKDGIYYGSQFIHYSNDRGLSWKIISPDLTTNDSTKLRQFESGGLTIDNTSAENHCTILCIAPSTLDKNLIWAGTDDGNVQLTTDGGRTWQNVSALMPGFPSGGWVPQIVPSQHRPSEVFVVVNNYRQNDWKPYLYHSVDMGRTWRNLVSENEVNGHCLSVVQDPVQSSLLFLGTEHGLYVSFDGGTDWHQWTFGYPKGVATQDLKIHPREHDLIIGTFGRAAYILDNIQPLRTYARERDAMLNKRIVAIPSSPATLAAYKQPSGARFAASLEFEGQNKQGGAALTYYYSVEKKEEVTSAKDDKKKGKKTVEEKPAAVAEDKSAKPKKVKVVIMNNAGDTLRWFTHEPDTGINIIHWYFDTEGVRLPSRRESKPDADPPGNGPAVFPGTYKVVYIFGEHRDSTSVEVGYDPRLPHNPEALNAQLALYERWKTAAGKSRKAYELVKQMKKDIEHAKGTWLNVNDSLKKDVVVLSDSLLKQLNELEGLFMSPENQSGITDDSEYLVSKFWNATGYLNTGAEMPGSNSETAIRLLEKANDEVVTKVSSFVSEQFTPWRQRAEQVPVQLFKPLEKLE